MYKAPVTGLMYKLLIF